MLADPHFRELPADGITADVNQPGLQQECSQSPLHAERHDHHVGRRRLWAQFSAVMFLRHGLLRAVPVLSRHGRIHCCMASHRDRLREAQARRHAQNIQCRPDARALRRTSGVRSKAQRVLQHRYNDQFLPHLASSHRSDGTDVHQCQYGGYKWRFSVRITGRASVRQQHAQDVRRLGALRLAGRDPWFSTLDFRRSVAEAPPT